MTHASAGATDAIAAVTRVRPDVVVLDVRPPVGTALARTLLAAHPAIALVVIGVALDAAEVALWADAGVGGCVSESSSLEDVISSIEAASRGDTPCSPDLAGLLLRGLRLGSRPRGDASLELARLTRREWQILELVTIGLTNKQIAQTLCVEVSTVKNHLHAAFAKLGVNHRSDAARLAAPHAGLEPRDPQR